jgi:hypothetical protein
MTTQNANLVAITGNTYPVKEQLKALGARWNGDRKAWMVTPDKVEAAKAIVAGAGAKKPYSGGRARSFGRGGAWNGCSMGCRDGAPNPRCRQCCFDEYDN